MNDEIKLSEGYVNNWVLADCDFDIQLHI